MDKLKLAALGERLKTGGERLKTGGAQISRTIGDKMKEMLQGPTQESKMVDEATSNNLAEPNWGLNLRICALLNGDELSGPEVVKAIKKKIVSNNMPSQSLSLDLLEACAMNCEKVFSAIASEKVLDEMVRMIENPQTHYTNRQKAMQLIRAWGESDDLGYLPVFHQTYMSLKARGSPFSLQEDVNLEPLFSSVESGPDKQPLPLPEGYPKNSILDQQSLAFHGVPLSADGKKEFLAVTRNCIELLSSMLNSESQNKPVKRSFKLLSIFVVPCFCAESAYKIWWYCSGASRIPFLGNVYLSDPIACVLELCSWLYRTSIFFLVCVLFHLICHLQILRLQDFTRVFTQESDVVSMLTEHMRIEKHLRIISHRFRSFILLTLFFVTASQFASLLNTTKSHADVNIFRAGELALCSMGLVTGLFICLRSAAKITHKAQAITCHAAKWHVCATIDSFDTIDCEAPSPTHITDAPPPHRRPPPSLVPSSQDHHHDVDDSSEDSDSSCSDSKFLPLNAAITISFQKRQALVTYFENNRAGITVFGFMLDRAGIQIIFGIEMSLVLWLLGKTVGIS